MITQRMRDVARAELCGDFVQKFSACTQQSGFKMVYSCTAERDELVKCIEDWFVRPGFKEMVSEEYLNERSHFRETGIKTKRYERSKYVPRDLDKDGPSLDDKGQYRPRKPRGWDESYPDGPPAWTTYNYRR